MVDDKTKIVSSIAGKRSKLSAAMHNAAYEDLGLNFLYIPFKVEDLKSAIVGIKALGFRGSAVTMPYKKEVMKHLDNLDKTAKKIGAVNTILNNDGKLTGYNSDWIGAMESLKEICVLKNKKVVLVGAGGAARAIAYGLKENNAEVFIFNRTVEKAKELTEEFNLHFGGSPDDITKLDDYDILINATSVGFNLEAGKSIVDSSSMKKNKIVMDVVTHPIITPILDLAQKKNCKIISGYKMLIYQAIFQIRLWTGKEPKFEVMEKALLDALKS